jgi:RNA polymerase sigma-70 factor (ECF subfamily)
MTRSSYPLNPASGDTSDADLVRILRGADPARRRLAATELLMRYRDAVYAWCFRYARDHDRALDLSQDVMVTAWQRMESFEGRSQFSSWLFSVARNRCIDSSRRVNIMSEEVMLDDPTDPAPAPDEALAAEESEGMLMDLIKSELNPLEQDAVYLRYFERRSVEDIGEFLRIEGSSGARAVLQRARRKLRAAAHKRFPNGGGLF